MDKTLIVLYLLAISVIGFLLYSMTKRAQSVKIHHRRSEIPPPASFETHHWGYAWRSYWKKYNGLPGFKPEDGKPLPEPKMPVAPKPVVINTKPILY